MITSFFDKIKNSFSQYEDIISWWEKKRLFYNILLITLSIFLLYSYWDYPMKTINGELNIILNSILFIFGANIFYTLGWATEVVFLRAYKIDRFSNIMRWILFLIGTFISLIWTNMHYAIEFDVLFAY